MLSFATSAGRASMRQLRLKLHCFGKIVTPNATPLMDIGPDRLVDGIREWVACETPPHDEPRLREFAELAAHQARQTGLHAELIPVGSSELPLVRIVADSASAQKPVLVLAHYDTVHPVGTPTLDGLGAEGDGAHTLREYITVASLPQRLAFWHALLRDLAWEASPN
jgi:acetylornithine deacetylase/succinyl-diaminopimelate desuccinylase-like protein